MSNATKVEQRVVQMRFDNKGFAAGVENTLGALKDLQNGILNAENLTKALGKIDMTALNNAVENIGYRFSNMGIIATTVLQNLASEAYYTAKAITNSLSVDQVFAGWDKYNEKTVSVQTIMSATGKSIQEVEKELDRLQWFTDETSYNFTDMVNSIGKFTSAGLSLEKSRVAMQGIATWAAKSGVNATDASRAMFQLSQAIAQGSIKGNDWMSIESLNMATQEFKQTVLDTAVAMGKLTKQGDKYITKYDKVKHAFDINSFRTYLSDSWFTSDVFMKAMEKYGNYADKLKDFMDENDIDTAAEALRQMGAAGDEFGMAAFEAAQVTRTFEDAINATKDAVSSGWSKTWQIVFGDLEEAKVLWGGLVDRLWDAFAASGETRNSILQTWKELGGRTTLIDSFWKAWDSVVEVIAKVKEGFREIFPPKTGKDLNDLTSRIFLLAKGFEQFNKDHLDQFKTIGKGVAAVIDIVLTGVSKLWSFFTKSVDTFKGDKSILDIIINGLSKIAEIVIKLDERIKEVGFFQTFKEQIQALWEALPKLIDLFKGEFVKVFEKFVKYFKELTGIDIKSGPFKILGELFKILGNVISGVFPDSFSTVSDAIGSIFDRVNNATVKVFEWFTDVFKDFCEAFSNAFGWAVNGAGKLFKWMGDGLGILVGYFKELNWFDLLKLLTVLDKIAGILKPFNDAINRVAQDVPDFLKNLADAFGNLQYGSERFMDWMDYWTKGLQGLVMNINVGTILELSAALFLMAEAMKVIASIPENQLMQGAVGLGAMIYVIGEVASALETIESRNSKDRGAFSNFLGKKGIASMIMSLAVSMIILAGALKILQTIDFNSVMKGLLAVGVLMAELVVFLNRLAGKRTFGNVSVNGGKMSFGDSKGTSASTFGAVVMVLAVANAMILLSAAMKIISTIDANGIIKGLGSIGALLIAIWAFMEKLNSITSKNFKMNVDLGNGSKASQTTKNGSNFGAFAGIFMIAMSLLVLSAVMKIIATMEWEEIGKGLAGVLGSLVLLVGFMAGFNKVVGTNGTNLLMGAGAVQTITLAIIEMVAAILLAALIPEDRVERAFGTVLGGLVVLAGFIWFISKSDAIGMLAGGGAIFAAAAGLVLIAGAFLLMDNLDPKKLENSTNALMALVIVVGFCVGLLGGLASSGAMLAAGGAIALLSAGIILLAGALKIMETTNIDTIISALGSLVIVLVSLTGMATVLGMFWEVLLPGAAIMLALGAASVVLGIGLEFLGSGIESVSEGLMKFLELLSYAIVLFTNTAVSLSNLLMTFLPFTKGKKYEQITVADLWGEDIGGAFGSGFEKGIQNSGASDSVDELMEKIGKVSKTTAEEKGEETSDAFTNSIVSQFIDTDEVFDEITNSLGDKMSFNLTDFTDDTMVQKLMDETKSQFPELEDLYSDAGNIMFEGLTGHSEEYTKASDDMRDALLSSFESTNTQKETKKSVKTFVDLVKGNMKSKELGKEEGENVTEGYGQGLLDAKAVNNTKSKARQFVDIIFKELKAASKSHSPSVRAREEVGKWVPYGVAEGLIKYSSVSTAAADLVADGIFGALGEALSSTDNLINSNLTLDPTITPLMDTSQIQNGIGQINSMFGSGNFMVNGGFGVASANILSSMASQISESGKANENVVNAINSLKSDIKNLGDYVSGLEIRMDSGALVGSIASPMDKQLGIRAARSRRERPR